MWVLYWCLVGVYEHKFQAKYQSDPSQRKPELPSAKLLLKVHATNACHRGMISPAQAQNHKPQKGRSWSLSIKNWSVTWWRWHWVTMSFFDHATMQPCKTNGLFQWTKTKDGHTGTRQQTIGRWSFSCNAGQRIHCNQMLYGEQILEK